MANCHALTSHSLLNGPRLPSRSTPTLRACKQCRRTGLLVTARAGLPGMGMLGTKAGMTQIFEGSLAIPASVIAIDTGNIVTQIKTEATDGYNSVQIGYEVVPDRKLTKPEVNHLKKAEAPPMRTLREFKIKDVEEYSLGQQLKVDEIFKVGDLVDVAGTSIGKGFSGSIKRWNMHRGPMSHGSKSHRQHGSIGASASPSRVFPGLKMAGQLGNERVRIRKLKVLLIDPELNAIVVKGAIPGKAGNLVEVTPAKIVGKNC